MKLPKIRREGKAERRKIVVHEPGQDFVRLDVPTLFGDAPILMERRKGGRWEPFPARLSGPLPHFLGLRALRRHGNLSEQLDGKKGFNEHFVSEHFLGGSRRLKPRSEREGTDTEGMERAFEKGMALIRAEEAAKRSGADPSEFNEERVVEYMRKNEGYMRLLGNRYRYRLLEPLLRGALRRGLQKDETSLTEGDIREIARRIQAEREEWFKAMQRRRRGRRR